MPRLRRLSSSDVLRILHRFGFEVAAQQSGHAKLVRVSPGGDRRILIVPLHRNLAVGTLHAIYRQATRLAPSDDLRQVFFAD